MKKYLILVPVLVTGFLALSGFAAQEGPKLESFFKNPNASVECDEKITAEISNVSVKIRRNALFEPGNISGHPDVQIVINRGGAMELAKDPEVMILNEVVLEEQIVAKSNFGGTSSYWRTRDLAVKFRLVSPEETLGEVIEGCLVRPTHEATFYVVCRTLEPVAVPKPDQEKR